MPRLPSKFKYFTLTNLIDIALINIAYATYLGNEKYSVIICVMICALWVITNVLFYPNSNRRYTSYIHTFYNVIKPISAFMLLYYITVGLIYNSWNITASLLLFFIVVFSVVIAGKAFFVFSLRIYRSKGNGFSNYILFGESIITNKMKLELDRRIGDGYRFRGAFDWNQINTFKGHKNIEKIIRKEDIDDAFFFVEEQHRSDFEFIKPILNQSGVSIFQIPSDLSRHIKIYNFRRLNNSSFQEVLFGPLERNDKRTLKRIFDFLFAAFITLFLLSWLLPVLALLIRLESKGNPFFIQKRHGKNGELFKCIKLRSMKSKSSNTTFNQATVNDNRITKIGAFLRRSNLDELPQFINVLLGSMSVVGPRPHVPELDDEFQDKIPFYDYRHRVLPGITGLSQSFGYRGETPTVAIMQKRTDVDRLYIQNWTLLLDLKIIFSTIKNSIFLRRNVGY